MSKIRLTRTTIVEYEPTLEYYPEGMTLEEMAKMDTEQDEAYLIFEDPEFEEIKIEIVD